MNHPILVCGALGNVGTQVVKSLLQQGAPVRAAEPSPEAVRHHFGQGLEAVRFDFHRPETFAPALQGVKRMFLMRPPQISQVERLLFPAVDAARAAGVEQVVFLSLIGVERIRLAPHFRMEQYLRTCGMTWTFLRASFFMQNLNTVHVAEIRNRDEIFIPAGHGKTSFIDVRDIGAVAALTLTQTGHENRTYDLTGSDALDYYQAAEQFSQVLGRTITYRSPSLLSYVAAKIRNGTPLPYLLITAWLYDQTRRGMSAQVSGDVQRLLGRPPIRLRQYIEDYRSAWSQPPRLGPL